MAPESDADAFQRLYAAHIDLILGYALRRVSAPADAADVAAETFLVAWRRRAALPQGDAARLWLYGVARRTLANQRRGDRRRSELGTRLRDELSAVLADPYAAASLQTDIARAMDKLRSSDREVVELTAWESLSSSEVAEVLAISPTAARARLSRARSRLRIHLGYDPLPPARRPTATAPHIAQEDR